MKIVKQIGVLTMKKRYGVLLGITSIMILGVIWAGNYMKSQVITVDTITLQPVTEENTVTCTATVSEGQVLMTTIPWQSGWKAYANGNEVEVICASGALLGVNTGPGIHDIRLVYQPEDFSTDLLLSAVFMFSGFLLTCILDSDRINRIYEYSRSLAGHQTAPPPEEDIFATYSDYMIPDIQSLDDQEDDFSDYFNGM